MDTVWEKETRRARERAVTGRKEKRGGKWMREMLESAVQHQSGSNNHVMTVFVCTKERLDVCMRQMCAKKTIQLILVEKSAA